MAEQLNVAMVQMQVGKSLSDNLTVARQKCSEAAALGAELVVLPEYFADMYGAGADPRDADHPPPCPTQPSQFASTESLA